MTKKNAIPDRIDRTASAEVLATWRAADLRRIIRREWPSIVARSKVSNPGALPVGPFRLLGSSTKIEKGLSVGVLAAVCYLAPSTESGRNTCPDATAQCAAVCLGSHSGRMIYDSVRNARAWKTVLFYGWRNAFLALAAIEARALARKANRLGLIPAVRMDGSSDTGVGIRLAGMVRHVQFWDYTKNVPRALNASPTGRYSTGAGKRVPRNHHVTFSRSGENDLQCASVLSWGGSVAVVFDVRPGDPLPETFRFPSALGPIGPLRVVDGDETDARFLDRETFGIEPGAPFIVGLRFKQARNRAAALRAAGAFVVRA